MVSFCGVVAAILIAGTNIAGGQIANGLPAWEAILIAIALGGLIGLVQGLLITKLRMNPFIVTLGFRSMLLGVSLVLDARRGHQHPEGRVPVLPDRRRSPSAGLKIPMPFIIALIIYFISWFVLKHTKFGRYTYAIGGNETAARLSGINVDLLQDVHLRHQRFPGGHRAASWSWAVSSRARIRTART